MTTRPSAHRVALLVGALLVASAPPAPAAPADGAHFAHRAFTARAEAYPLEPAPGTQDTEVAIRPSATTAAATNPPSAAFARAAATDLGLAEAYFGQQGPSVAADTSTQNDPRDVERDEDGFHLEAHVTDAPTAEAIARGDGDGSGTPSGSFASRSDARGDGPVLTADAQAEANDVSLGPFVLGSGRYEASVRLDGTPEGASGSGTITTSDATFAGIPIVIESDGFRVDETRVPAPLLGEATAAVQEYFSPGGYADIRVVQPEVEVAEDGTSVRVSGGGVHVFFTNNDPTERYFLGFTMLGGDVLVALGGELGQPTDTVSPVAPPPSGAGAPGPPAAPAEPAPPIAPDAPPAPAPASAGEPVAISYDAGHEVLPLRGLWGGLVWVLLAVAIAWMTALALHTPWLSGPRRRIDDLLDGFADRYTRG